MCGDPPSSPVISSDSEKSFSSAVKRCICTWWGKGKSVTPRIPVVSYQGNADDTEKGSHLWKYFENFSKILSAMTSSVLSIWYPIYRELDRPNSFSKLSTLNSFWFPKAIQFSLLCMKTACQGQPMGRAVPWLRAKASLEWDMWNGGATPKKQGSATDPCFQTFSPIKKARWKIPCLSSGFSLTPCRKARFRQQGAWRSLPPIRRVKNPVRAFPSYPGMLHIIFPWSPPLCPLPYTLCITAQASCYNTPMRIRYISFCLYHNMKRADESIHNSSVLCVTIYLF